MKATRYEIHAESYGMRFVATGYAKGGGVAFRQEGAPGLKPWKLGPELAEAMVQRAIDWGWDALLVLSS